MARVQRYRPPRLGADTRAKLRAVLLDPNVVGYGFGARRCGDEWFYGHYLCLYVRRKFSPEQIRERRRYIKVLPRKLGDYAVDVLPVGDLQLHVLDHRDDFGGGSVAAFARDDDGSVLALVSGHAASGATLVASDRYDSSRFSAAVLDRAVGGPVDWALARFTSDLDKIRLPLAHGQEAPLAFRRGGWQAGESVSFYSGEQNALRQGVLVHHDGVVQQYSQLLVIRASDGGGNFSTLGDSGALVFDSHDRALGMIVGGGHTTTPGSSDIFRGTYIATIAALGRHAGFGPYFSRFFA